MDWKTRAIVLGVSMLVLAVIGLIVHTNLRLVGADVLGAGAVIGVILLANRGGAAAVALPILATVAFLGMALLAVTSHSSPITTALTLAFAFAFAFVSWPALSSRRRPEVAGRPPRTA
jgi:hypothetical protein